MTHYTQYNIIIRSDVRQVNPKNKPGGKQRDGGPGVFRNLKTVICKKNTHPPSPSYLMQPCTLKIVKAQKMAIKTERGEQSGEREKNHERIKK